MQAYSDPSRESDPHALPDVETCSPGCLPDGEANGPFKTQQEALEDAQDI